MKLFLSLTSLVAYRSIRLPSLTKPFDSVQKLRFCAATVEKPVHRKIEFKRIIKPIPEESGNSENLIQAVLKSLNFDERILREIVQRKPEIMTFDPTCVISNLTQLMKLGFEYHDIKVICRKYPHILTFKNNDIYETFETWRKNHLFEKFLWNFFVEHPHLFAISNDEVERRVSRIFYLMTQKINRVTRLLLKNPHIMICPWDEVEEKFKYLYYSIRVLEKDISNSSALSLPLDHIKLRYMCLERCGEYIRPKKKEELGFDPRVNPPLASVVDTDDKVFAINIAKISPEEYDVFKKLMNYEEKLENYDPSEYHDDEIVAESEFDIE